MAQKKLLPSLVKALQILLFILINQGFLAHAASKDSEEQETRQSFENLREKSLDAAMEHFEKILGDAKKDGYFKGKNDPLKAHASDNKLLVFVSDSMPREVLKNYYIEAEIYGATLVFNGLPNESFAELGNLITGLHESAANMHLRKRRGGAAVIDDESFRKFKVGKVPTLVLAQEKNCYIEKTCKQSFDKLEGNVGVKYALEKFSESGSLKKEARELLQ